MKRKNRKIAGAIALIAALAAGGAAFTASNSLPPTDTAGYGSVSVTGATVSDISNQLSADGKEITQVTLTFASSQAGNTVTSGFSDAGGTLDSCTDTNSGTDTIYTCPATNTTGAGINGHESTAAAANFAVAVTH